MNPFCCFPMFCCMLRSPDYDNAETFKISSRELIKVARSSDGICHLKNHMRFFGEQAPWWGGFWERLICSIKDA